MLRTSLKHFCLSVETPTEILTRDVCERLMPTSLGSIHEEKERKLQIIGIFKGHNSVENSTIVPKIEPDLDIIMKKLYTNFISRRET